MKISYLTFWSAKSGESQAEAYDANFEEVRIVDEMGWDTVWAGGVPLGSMVPHTLMLAAAIAARTSQIKIGTAVHLPGLKAAEEEFTTEVKAGGSFLHKPTWGLGREIRLGF